jgi:hypothetical protein
MGSYGGPYVAFIIGRHGCSCLANVIGSYGGPYVAFIIGNTDVPV